MELINCNPQYAEVRYDSGRQSTVSLRDLAPYTVESTDAPLDSVDDQSLSEEIPDAPEDNTLMQDTTLVQDTTLPEVRRSGRVTKEPDRLGIKPT